MRGISYGEREEHKPWHPTPEALTHWHLLSRQTATTMPNHGARSASFVVAFSGHGGMSSTAYDIAVQDQRDV